MSTTNWQIYRQTIKQAEKQLKQTKKLLENDSQSSGKSEAIAMVLKNQMIIMNLLLYGEFIQA